MDVKDRPNTCKCTTILHTLSGIEVQVQKCSCLTVQENHFAKIVSVTLAGHLTIGTQGHTRSDELQWRHTLWLSETKQDVIDDVRMVC